MTVFVQLVVSALGFGGIYALAAWALGIIGGAAMGIAVDLGLMRRVEGSPPLVSIVMTIGLLLAVEGLTGVIWGYGPKGVANVIGGRSFAIGPISVDRNDLFVAALAVVAAVALHLFYERTRLGLAVRAV